jgi:hypothetical protein
VRLAWHWRKTDSNLWFRISGKRFFYTASEPQTGREPQPVLTTDNGRFTVGRARLAPAMISTPGHRASRRRQREALPTWCNVIGEQLQAARSNPPTTLPRFGVMPRRAKVVALGVTSAPVPANNRWYRGLTKLTLARNRWFESTSLGNDAMGHQRSLARGRASDMVSLPGIMTGQILGGVRLAEAVKSSAPPSPPRSTLLARWRSPVRRTCQDSPPSSSRADRPA